jgi:hypothetical protein
MIKLVHKLSRKRKYALLLALTIVVLAVAATNNLVSADPCSAYLSQPPPVSGTPYGSSTNLTVPVSATCPSVSGPLYVIGDAYDTTTNTDLGTVNTPLTPVNGPSMFNGQLAFTLPPVAQGDVVQITASIYSGVYTYSQTGPALTTTTIQIDPNGLANTQDPSGSPSQYCGSGPNCNYPNGSNGNSYPYSQGAYGNSHRHRHSNYSQDQQQQIVTTITQQVPVPLYLPPDNTWLIDLVITAVVAIAVVGAIAFAVLASRNRQPRTRPY